MRRIIPTVAVLAVVLLGGCSATPDGPSRSLPLLELLPTNDAAQKLCHRAMEGSGSVYEWSDKSENSSHIQLATQRGWTPELCAVLLVNHGSIQFSDAPPALTQPEIRTIQRDLVELGYSPGAIDGQVGWKTRIAISDFQTAQGGKAGYKVDKQLLSALAVAKATVVE